MVLKWVWNLQSQCQRCIVLPIFHFYYQAADIHNSLLTFQSGGILNEWMMKNQTDSLLVFITFTIWRHLSFYLHQPWLQYAVIFYSALSFLNSTFLRSNRKCSRNFLWMMSSSFYFWPFIHFWTDSVSSFSNKALCLGHSSHYFLRRAMGRNHAWWETQHVILLVVCCLPLHVF